MFMHFGRKKFRLTSYTIKVDTISSFRRTTVRKVLNNARGVRRFRITDYDDYFIVDVSGNFDSQKLLKKLAGKGIHATLFLHTSKPTLTRDFFYNEYDHLYDDDSFGSGYNYWDGHGYGPHGGAGWRCCHGDYDARCCGLEGYPPGPFAELAREFLGPRHRCRRPPPPPPVIRQTVNYVKRSVGCFNFGW